MFAENEGGCSVSHYDTKRAAEILREEIIKKNNVNAVVFYDPLPRIKRGNNKNWEKTIKNTEKESEKLLIAQVTDFIVWAKNEGLIK